MHTTTEAHSVSNTKASKKQSARSNPPPLLTAGANQMASAISIQYSANVCRTFSKKALLSAGEGSRDPVSVPKKIPR